MYTRAFSCIIQCIFREPFNSSGFSLPGMSQLQLRNYFLSLSCLSWAATACVLELTFVSLKERLYLCCLPSPLSVAVSSVVQSPAEPRPQSNPQLCCGLTASAWASPVLSTSRWLCLHVSSQSESLSYCASNEWNISEPERSFPRWVETAISINTH